MELPSIRPSQSGESSNFFAALDTCLSQVQVAEVFERAGWARRRASWAAYAVQTSWAELLIEAKRPILLHGSVTDIASNANRILGVLKRAGLPYEGECYGPGGELMREFRSPGSRIDRTP